MRRCIGIAVVLWGILLWMGTSYAEDPTLSSIRSQVEGSDVRGGLRQADRLLTEVLALKIKALARLGRADDALRSYDVLVVLQRKENLPLLQEVAWARFVSLVRQKNPKAQQMAADFLGELGDKRAVKLLLPLLRSSQFLTRQKAAEALGHLKDSAASSALSRLLGDKSTLVRYSAAWALGNIGDSKGVSALEKCFKERNGGTKLRCASLLAKLKKRSVLGFLRKELRSNSNRRARAVIAEGLSLFRDSRWVRLVSKDLKADTESSRLVAARTLGELKARAARRELRNALGDRSIKVRISAAQSLGQLGSKRGTQVLLYTLKNKSSLVRADAAQALSYVKNRKTQQALIEALSDSHLLVRLYASHALVRLGRQEGGSILREGMVRGNPPLQALAAKFAYLASKESSLRGRPVERMSGEIPQASKVKAFDEGESMPDDPDDGDSGSGKTEPPKTASANSGKPPERRTNNTKKPKPRRGAPPKRRGGGGDDGGDDGDW